MMMTNEAKIDNRMKIVNGEIEIAMEAIALSQSNDPMDRALSRAIKSIAVPINNYMNEEFQRAQSADDVGNSIHAAVSMMSSTIVTVIVNAYSHERWEAIRDAMVALMNDQVKRGLSEAAERKVKP
jgi:hypothetical protein